MCIHVGLAPHQTSPASRERGWGGRCLASVEEEETPRQGSRKSEEDTTLHLLLKHPKTTVATYD